MQDKSTKNLLNGAAWLGFSAILLKIIGLIYKIPMSYLLGDEGMGYFNSAYTVYTFFYIIGSAGIPKAVSILCAKSTPGEAKSVFALVFKIYLLIGVGLSLILLIFAEYIAKSIGSINSFYTIFAIAPSVFFVCASGVLRGYLNGKIKFIPVAVSELISAASKLFLGLVFAICAIKKGFSLPLVSAFSILGITLGSFFGFLYLYFAYFKESKNIKREYLKNRAILKEVLRIGLPITFAAMISGIVNIIDLWVMVNRLKAIGYSESLGMIIYGNYTTLAVPMFSFATNLINTVSVAALPIMTRAFSTKEYDQVQKSASSSVKILSIITVPIFLAFFTFPREILGSVFEEGSATVGFSFLLLLSPGILFYSYLTLFNTILEAKGKIKAAVTSLSIGAVLKCILSCIFVGMDEIGPLGAPISTTLSYGVSLLISLYFYNKYITKTTAIRLPLARSISLSFLFGSLSAILATICRKMMLKNLDFRMSSIFSLGFYGVFCVIFGIIPIIIYCKKRLFSAECTTK